MNDQLPDPPRAAKRPGPKVRLPKQEKFSTNLPPEYRQRLEDYSDKHKISMAEALRRAIDALEK